MSKFIIKKDEELLLDCGKVSQKQALSYLIQFRTNEVKLGVAKDEAMKKIQLYNEIGGVLYSVMV